MGLMLSVLVSSVGVIELLTVYYNVCRDFALGRQRLAVGALDGYSRSLVDGLKVERANIFRRLEYAQIHELDDDDFHERLLDDYHHRICGAPSRCCSSSQHVSTEVTEFIEQITAHYESGAKSAGSDDAETAVPFLPENIAEAYAAVARDVERTLLESSPCPDKFTAETSQSRERHINVDLSPSTLCDENVPVTECFQREQVFDTSSDAANDFVDPCVQEQSALITENVHNIVEQTLIKDASLDINKEASAFATVADASSHVEVSVTECTGQEPICHASNIANDFIDSSIENCGAQIQTFEKENLQNVVEQVQINDAVLAAVPADLTDSSTSVRLFDEICAETVPQQLTIADVVIPEVLTLSSETEIVHLTGECDLSENMPPQDVVENSEIEPKSTENVLVEQMERLNIQETYETAISNSSTEIETTSKDVIVTLDSENNFAEKQDLEISEKGNRSSHTERLIDKIDEQICTDALAVGVIDESTDLLLESSQLPTCEKGLVDTKSALEGDVIVKDVIDISQPGTQCDIIENQVIAENINIIEDVKDKIKEIQEINVAIEQMKHESSTENICDSPALGENTIASIVPSLQDIIVKRLTEAESHEATSDVPSGTNVLQIQKPAASSTDINSLLMNNNEESFTNAQISLESPQVTFADNQSAESAERNVQTSQSVTEVEGTLEINKPENLSDNPANKGVAECLQERHIIEISEIVEVELKLLEDRENGVSDKGKQPVELEESQVSIASVEENKEEDISVGDNSCVISHDAEHHVIDTVLENKEEQLGSLDAEKAKQIVRDNSIETFIDNESILSSLDRKLESSTNHIEEHESNIAPVADTPNEQVTLIASAEEDVSKEEIITTKPENTLSSEQQPKAEDTYQENSTQLEETLCSKALENFPSESLIQSDSISVHDTVECDENISAQIENSFVQEAVADSNEALVQTHISSCAHDEDKSKAAPESVACEIRIDSSCNVQQLHIENAAVITQEQQENVLKLEAPESAVPSANGNISEAACLSSEVVRISCEKEGQSFPKTESASNISQEASTEEPKFGSDPSSITTLQLENGADLAASVDIEAISPIKEVSPASGVTVPRFIRQRFSHDRSRSPSPSLDLCLNSLGVHTLRKSRSESDPHLAEDDCNLIDIHTITRSASSSLLEKGSKPDTNAISHDAPTSPNALTHSDNKVLFQIGADAATTADNAGKSDIVATETCKDEVPPSAMETTAIASSIETQTTTTEIKTNEITENLTTQEQTTPSAEALEEVADEPSVIYEEDFLRSLDGVKRRPLSRTDERRRTYRKKRSASSPSIKSSRSEELLAFSSIEQNEELLLRRIRSSEVIVESSLGTEDEDGKTKSVATAPVLSGTENPFVFDESSTVTSNLGKIDETNLSQTADNETDVVQGEAPTGERTDASNAFLVEIRKTEPDDCRKDVFDEGNVRMYSSRATEQEEDVASKKNEAGNVDSMSSDCTLLGNERSDSGGCSKDIIDEANVKIQSSNDPNVRSNDSFSSTCPKDQNDLDNIKIKCSFKDTAAASEDDTRAQQESQAIISSRQICDNKLQCATDDVSLVKQSVPEHPSSTSKSIGGSVDFTDEIALKGADLLMQTNSNKVSGDQTELSTKENKTKTDGQLKSDQSQEQKQQPQPPKKKQEEKGREAFWLIFSGEYTKAMNKDWHGQHFCCWQCDESLTGQRYVLRDEHPYCVSCYESVFANSCEKCSKTIGIDSKDLSYKDKHWHEACFLCTSCGESLVDKQFGSKADRIYCGRCYDDQFASRCDGCHEIFRAGTKKMEYKTRQWHEKCFCCCVCKTPIGTQSFIPREQEIYCAKCYEEKFATRCVKCNKVITSGGVTYKNEPWHRECFTCTNCSTSLAGQRFTSRDDKPYCAECFGELFAKRCTSCSKPITGIGGTRFISFEDRHWHNDCFICASCQTSLVGRGFITDQSDIICPECAKQKLL